MIKTITRRALSIAVAFALASTPVLLSLAPQDAGAATLDKRRGAGSFSVGFVSVNQGAFWGDLMATKFKTLTTGTVAAGDYIVDFSIKNTHATQTLYILFRPNANEAITEAYPLAAGAELAMSDLIWAANGNPLTTIAIRGSGAGTTALIVATFSRGSVSGGN